LFELVPQRRRLPLPKGLFYCKALGRKSQYAQNNFLYFVENWLFCKENPEFRGEEGEKDIKNDAQRVRIV
jgi:hypothetical protein